jgi:hypothetical protein
MKFYLNITCATFYNWNNATSYPPIQSALKKKKLEFPIFPIFSLLFPKQPMASFKFTL